MKILLIKLRAIGDIILSTPVIENLRLEYPQAKIDVLVEKFAMPVLESNPFINKILVFDKKIDSSFGLIKKVRNEKYDLVIDLFGNPRTALITFLSGAKKRVGFDFRFRSYAYNILVNPKGNEIHNIEFNLDSLRKINIPIKTNEPKYYLSENISDEIKNWKNENINANDLKIGINAGGGWEIKQWKSESFAKLSDKLVENYSAKIFLFWGPNEFEIVKNISDKMKNKCVLIPKTNLNELAFIIKEMNLIISNDSGPMHISSALNLPTLGIYGPTNPFLQGPTGEKSYWIRKENLDCIACNKIKCDIGNICMRELEVENVYLKSKNILERELNVKENI
ncbi:MAG: lipopolysaccharide heptosyltransferase II [Bacteroidota bacterium]